MESQIKRKQAEFDALYAENKELKEEIEKEEEQRQETEERAELVEELDEKTRKKDELDSKLKAFQRSDPERVKKLKEEEEELKREINTYTDNIFVIRDWMLEKNPNLKEADMNKHFEIPEDMDNV